MSTTILHARWPLHHQSLVRGLIERVRQRLGSAASSLHGLDARALADIGIDRSEIGSIECESQGRAQLTRLRVAAGL